MPAGNDPKQYYSGVEGYQGKKPPSEKPEVEPEVEPEPVTDPEPPKKKEKFPLTKRALLRRAKARNQRKKNMNSHPTPPDDRIVKELKRLKSNNPESPPKKVSKPTFKKKFFVYMLGLSALVVASCAAFFSVRGIGLLFSGSMMAVVIMAAGLEFGKLVAASYLYRYWKKTTFLLKTYLMAAVILLIGITSLGVFGFLSDAFEKTKIQVALYETKIAQVEENNIYVNDQIEQVKSSAETVDEKADNAVDDFKKIYDDFIVGQKERRDLLLDRRKELDGEVSALESQPGGLFSSKKKKLEALRAVQAEERESITAQLKEIETQNKTEYDSFLQKVDSYKEKTAEVDIQADLDSFYQTLEKNNDKIIEFKSAIANTDIGSFKFIARAFDLNLDVVVKYFMLIIVIVFDPLSVCLVLAYNVALKRREDD